MYYYTKEMKKKMKKKKIKACLLGYENFPMLGIVAKCDSFFQMKLVSFGRWVVFSCLVWKKNKIAH